MDEKYARFLSLETLVYQSKKNEVGIIDSPKQQIIAKSESKNGRKWICQRAAVHPYPLTDLSTY